VSFCHLSRTQRCVDCHKAYLPSRCCSCRTIPQRRTGSSTSLCRRRPGHWPARRTKTSVPEQRRSSWL
jgi:hypothetical protein